MTRASVSIENTVVGSINKGLLVLLGVTHTDSREQADQLAKKVVYLRIFPDSKSKMNLSLIDVGGDLLVISQFTLYGDTQKGNRPSYAAAARPEVAEPLYEQFVHSCRGHGIRVETGKFQAHMMVELINDGPVTLLCEAKSK